mgnify:CR=1 FL=1
MGQNVSLGGYLFRVLVFLLVFGGIAVPVFLGFQLIGNLRSEVCWLGKSSDRGPTTLVVHPLNLEVGRLHNIPPSRFKFLVNPSDSRPPQRFNKPDYWKKIDDYRTCLLQICGIAGHLL